MAYGDTVRRAYDPALSDVLADAGEPLTVTHAGKVWKIGFPTQGAKDRYEKLILDREKRLVLRQKEILSPADFSARVDRLAEQIEQRQFATGGVMWVRHAGTAQGWVMWVQALLTTHHPDVTADEVGALVADAGDEVRLALEVLVPTFFAWAVGLFTALVERTGDPTARAMVEPVKMALATVLARWTPSA